MSETQFDDFTDIYEAMIDWPRRLGAEGAFFRRLFGVANVKRVADVACGTGQHAAMFHSWGLEVLASDISQKMIARARQAFGEPGGLQWTVRSFDQLPGPAGSLDVVVCVGNSLALVDDADSAARALRHMLAATRPGGLVVVQVLNLCRFPTGACVWQKCMRKNLTQGEALIIKGVHRCEHHGFAELIVVSDQAGNPMLRSHSIRFLELRAEDLQAAAREGGAKEVMFFGGYQDDQAFDPATSTDLIMVATKGDAETQRDLLAPAGAWQRLNL